MESAENAGNTSVPRAESSESAEHRDVGDWAEHFDETYGLHYYVNTLTGECYWGNPADTGDTVEESSETGHIEPLLDERPADDVQGLIGNDYEAEDTKRQSTYGPNEVKGDAKDEDGFADHGHDHGYYTEVQPHDNPDPTNWRQQQTQQRRKLDYAALWREYYADTDAEGAEGSGAGDAEQYNPYAYEWDLEEGLEYPADEDGNAEEGDGEDSYDHFQSYEPYNEESAPKTVKNRSKDVQQGSTTQDYLHMARMYKLTRPYSDPSFLAMCVLCHTNFADMVFFPCEHRCVCSECIEKEHICSDSQMDRMSDGYCNCSLCAAVIKLILPSEGGAEVEKYWNWVYEEPVKLPNNFLRNFKHSAAVIRAVHVRNPGQDVATDPDSFENASKSCCVS